ncbi:MAG: WG repeat-containing protein [Lentimicrobiaceae bacterium]|nr:WG repeat-containing protein [Lentimicrobiaceae bacterium]
MNKGGKFGYINHLGKEITPIKYDHAVRFYWDVGKVQLNGKWGLVNLKGREITSLVYDEIKGHQDPIVRIGSKYGFVSRKTGKLLTPVKYDDAKQWTQVFKSFHFRKDLALVQLGGKWGCVNLKGNEVVPPQYEKIEINQFDNPRIAAKLNGKWGFINDNGKDITAFEYDEVTQFHNCRARVKKNDKYGFINTKGANTCFRSSHFDCQGMQNFAVRSFHVLLSIY